MTIESNTAFGGTSTPTPPSAQSQGNEPASSFSPAHGSAETGSNTSSRSQQSQPRGILDSVKQRAANELYSQRDRATEGLTAVAEAVRHTTDELQREQPTVAHYVGLAADQLDRLSEALRTTEPSALWPEVQRMARRQPALFIGASFVAGLAVARFLKSSRQDGDSGGTIPMPGTGSDRGTGAGYGRAW
jgi:hypothetical protein